MKLSPRAGRIMVIAAASGVLMLAVFIHNNWMGTRTGSNGADEAAEFVPGGVAVLPGADVPVRAEELVARGVRGVPLEPSAIQRRIRAIALKDVRSLRPPAAGQEDQAARRFTFRLFEDVEFTGLVTRLERHGRERAVYSGKLEDIPGDFILAYNEGSVVATFSTPTLGMYQIRPVGRGMHAAVELNPDALPPCESEKFHPRMTTPEQAMDVRARNAVYQMLASAAEAPPTEGGVFNGFGQQGGSDSGALLTEVDVLIVYTPAARIAAGGSAGMTALIDTAIARANSAMINSEVDLRLRLVRAEEVAYVETGSNSTDLSNLRNGTGALAVTATWRNESGADLVSLFTTASGGIANLFNSNASSGFSVTGIGNAEGTFTHEIGHNFGLLHDRDNTDPATLYPFSYGWRFTPAGGPELRTTMAYAPGLSIPYFSNPDVTYMGTPTGVAIGAPDQSHNAQMLRNTMAAVAAFRSASGNEPPVVALDLPAYSDPLMALDSVNVSATAGDADGTVQEVRFYRLKADDVYGFTNFSSTSLGADAAAPFGVTEGAVPAGFWTYAAVAYDTAGGFGVDTVSITVAPHYRRFNYPLPPGKSSVSIEGMNESGRIIGYGYSGTNDAADVQAAYWENGSITLLNPLPGDTGARAFAVHAGGEVYGESVSSTGVRRAVRWNGVNPVDISGVIAGFTASTATGVDELGRIYLTGVTDEGSTGRRRFNNPGSTNAGLNENWTKVTGNGVFAAGHDYDFDIGDWRAMRWNNGGTRLAPVAGYFSSWGRATNRSGAVIGYSSPSGGLTSLTSRPTFWAANSTTPVDLGTVGGGGGFAYDLNDFNHGVGIATSSPTSSVAFLWKGGGDLLDVNDLILPGAGTLTSAQAINNRGQIAGTGFDGSTRIVFLLDPLPGLDQGYWLAGHFNPSELEDPALTDDAANPAGDGISNLLKRAVGLDPRQVYLAGAGGSGPLPRVVFPEDGHLHLIIRRLRVPGDLHYHPEASATLAPGSWEGGLLEVVDVDFLDADFEEVTLRSVEPVADLDGMFVRLRVTR